MNFDPDKAQLDEYFLDEAREILQGIEQTLLSLLEEKTTEKVHFLMRSAHTLKGSAASVELETIKTIAHHLEDVFQALYPAELEVDSELGSLLLEGFECLSDPLNAILCDMPYDEGAILDKTAEVFAQLQTKLGDFFGREAPIPSSAELGFDVVGSIFAESVPQDLHQLELIIASQDKEKIESALRSQAEFFLNLAASYTLPGLEEISQCILKALESYPEGVLQIATAALANLQQAHIAVLAGDRLRGGEVSLDLRQWMEKAQVGQAEEFSSQQVPIKTEVKLIEAPESDTEALSSLFSQKSDNLQSKVPEVLAPLGKDALSSNSPIDRILQSIWTGESKTNFSGSEQTSLTPSPALSLRSNWQSDATLPSIRVAIKQLDELSHTIGELLIQENQQTLQGEQMHYTARSALQNFFRCQKQLNRIRDWSDKNLLLPKQRRQKFLPSSTNSKRSPFDALEMDEYSDLHLLLQNLTENMMQLGEKIEAIEEVFQQSRIQLGKRKQLLDRAQENLVEARTVPLIAVFHRFPRLVQQMIISEHKPAELKLSGTEVLVDKAICEKLYEPLMHLIRNAYDHGLEMPEIRRQQGKPEIGLISVRADRQGNRTIIQVQDDGQGLKWESIRSKAITKQLLSSAEAASATEAQLIELLFEPGFTTTDKISELSGRGVGLDVVRKQLQDLQGSISVRSLPGQGTTFILQLPLSLTTTRLLVCQCQGVTYALLYDAIASVLLPQPDQIQRQPSLSGKGIQTFLRIQEDSKQKLIPIRPLAELLNYQYPILFQEKGSSLSPFPIRERNQVPPLLLLKTPRQVVCLQVDCILVEQELVIKSFNSKINLPIYIQGYSVLGDGSLTLAIDPVELVTQTWETNSGSTSTLPVFGASSPVKPALASSEAKSTPSTQTLTIEPSQDTKQQPQVLIVDDSIVQRQSLLLTLKKAGYQVLQAGNGEEAITKLNHHPEIGLAICDIEMPRMNGFEFLGHCRQDPRLSQIPIIMLTTRSGEKHRQIAFAMGAKGYQTKPYSERELLEIVSRLIQRSQTFITSAKT